MIEVEAADWSKEKADHKNDKVEDEDWILRRSWWRGLNEEDWNEEVANWIEDEIDWNEEVADWIEYDEE